MDRSCPQYIFAIQHRFWHLRGSVFYCAGAMECWPVSDERAPKKKYRKLRIFAIIVDTIAVWNVGIFMGKWIDNNYPYVFLMEKSNVDGCKQLNL